MNELTDTTRSIAIMVENEDGTFSPLHLSKAQAAMLNVVFANMSSREDPLIANKEIKYKRIK